MSSQIGLHRGKIYIPPCRNKVCESWVLKIAESLKLDVDCVIKNNISGSFLSRFEKLFHECKITILHYCPHLWKRISSVEKTLRKQEHKIVLIRFEDDELAQKDDGKACGQDVLDSLDIFFADFDSDLVINDDAEVLRSFKEDILSCLSESESSTCQDIVTTPSESVTDSGFTSVKEYEMAENSESEDEKEEDVKFEKYPKSTLNTSELVSNVNDVFVCDNFAQFDGHKEINFSQIETKALKKTMQQINDFEEKYSKQELTATLKYILHQMLPAFYEKKDVVKLASFSMCRYSHIHERALDLLELLLWDKVDHLQKFNTLVHLEEILNAALLDLNHDYKTSNENSYLMMLQRVANVYLILIGSIIIQSQETPNLSSIYSSYLDTRSQHRFEPSKTVQHGMVFELHKQADLCLGIVDGVVGGANMSKQERKFSKPLSGLDKDNPLGKLTKKSLAVHLVVVIRLLSKVFLLDREALSLIGKYMDGPHKKSPFVFMILHSLTLFLAYKAQQMTNQDIKTFCEETVQTIGKAIPNGPVNHLDDFLQRLLFSSNPSIRTSLIGVFIKSARYGNALLYGYLQNEIEQRLSPLLTDFELLKNSSGTLFGWKKASGQINGEGVWIFFYLMTQRDHNNNKISSERSEDLSYTEMKRLACLQHKNIVKMYAYQDERIPQFYIIESCMHTLQENLKNKRENGKFYLPSELLQFLLDAVSGLKFCHSKDYVHCNLTAESLIVVNRRHVKLAWFGLCKKIQCTSDPNRTLIQQSNVQPRIQQDLGFNEKLPSVPSFSLNQRSTVEAGTEKAMEINSKHIPIRWSAPESILEGEFSKASDIWMVGHLLYEVMTHGMLPYSNMDKNDEELITLMKSKQLKLTIEPVVEKGAILQLLSDCASYEQESRTFVANVKTSLKNILIRVNQAPERPVVFPKLIDESKSSTNCSRGVPPKFHKKTTGKSFKNVDGAIINISAGFDKHLEGENFLFKEKIRHSYPSSMESSFASSVLDNILPPTRNICQKENEMKTIECVIPRKDSFSLLDVARNRKVKEVGVLISFMQRVASMLADLSRHSYVIGDVCAEHVYVELTDTPKVHIISLAHLRTINSAEELDQSDDQGLDLSETVERRASPEVILSGRFSAASDVFCFGNLMWQVLAAFSAGNDMFASNKYKIFNRLSGDKISDAILSGNWTDYHKQPECCPDSLYQLIKSCVSQRENERPTMDHVAVKLTEHCEPIVEDDSVSSNNIQNNNDTNSDNDNSDLFEENVIRSVNVRRKCLVEENPSIDSRSPSSSISSYSNNSSASSLSVANPSSGLSSDT